MTMKIKHAMKAGHGTSKFLKNVKIKIPVVFIDVTNDVCKCITT